MFQGLSLDVVKTAWFILKYLEILYQFQCLYYGIECIIVLGSMDIVTVLNFLTIKQDTFQFISVIFDYIQKNISCPWICLLIN